MPQELHVDSVVDMFQADQSHAIVLIDDTTHIIGYRELEQDEELTRDNASDCTICAKLIGIINAWKEMDNDAMMKKKEYNRKYNFLFDYEGGVTNASRLLVEKDVRVERVSAPV